MRASIACVCVCGLVCAILFIHTYVFIYARAFLYIPFAVVCRLYIVHTCLLIFLLVLARAAAAGGCWGVELVLSCSGGGLGGSGLPRSPRSPSSLLADDDETLAPLVTLSSPTAATRHAGGGVTTRDTHTTRTQHTLVVFIFRSQQSPWLLCTLLYTHLTMSPLPPFGHPHRLGLPMVVCVECLPADKPWDVWCLQHAGALAWRRGPVCACVYARRALVPPTI